MDQLKDYIADAKQMLASAAPDKNKYSEIENFILKNGSKFGKNPEFESLKVLMSEIAAKCNLRSIESLQEGFGLNSCAQ